MGMSLLPSFISRLFQQPLTSPAPRHQNSRVRRRLRGFSHLEDRFALDGEGLVASEMDVLVMNEEGQAVIDLYAAFDDEEDSDEELTFEIIGEYDTTLLEVAIDNGKLNLTGLLNAYGTTYVSFRATDTEGNSVDTYVAV